MKLSLHRQLQRLEGRMTQPGNQDRDVDRDVEYLIFASGPDIWEWILEIEIETVKDVIYRRQPSPDGQHPVNYSLADLLAHTRGWGSKWVGMNKFAWGFSLSTAARHHKEGKDDWGLLYLLGLTPAQFAATPCEKQEDVLAEVRKRVEPRFQELGEETVDSFRHPKELFQAISDLNLSELCQTIR